MPRANKSRFLLALAAASCQALFGTPSINTPVVSPSSLVANVTVSVTVTCQINTAAGDPAIIQNGVNLVRMNSDGSNPAVVGQMYDDGTHGDTTAAYGIYTLQFNDTEPSPGQFEFQCTAAFTGLLQRIKSPTVLVTVTPNASTGVISTPSFSPATVPYGVSTTVTTTVSISGGTPDADSVMLQRLDSSGRVIAILGTLHDDGLNGDPVANDGNYTLVTTFTEFAVGAVPLRVSATFSNAVNHALSPITNLSVTGTPPPTVTITSPSDLSYLNITPTTVTGTVSDPTAKVVINAINAPVDSTGTFSATVPLTEGPNILTAAATSPSGTTGTASITVTLDTTPPHVTVTSPTNQFTTTDSSISVAGIVNDIVVGTVNSQQATVKVSGSPAYVANRTFLAPNVPLNLGVNTIQVVAIDRAGNSATTQVVVTRANPQPGQISTVSGNNQTAVIGTAVPAPLVVSLTDSTGAPAVNKQVLFSVTQNNGMLSVNGGTPAASVLATTDANGNASVNWTLGMRAGAGSDAVQAYSVGYSGTALFTASANLGTPGLIVVDTGNNQTGAVNQSLPKPLIAVVIDAGNNRLPNVPVTFTVVNGGGSFAGQPSTTVTTDSDGRAAATLTLGFQEGNSNNLVTATFPGNTAFPASFAASGLGPGNPNATVISGVVLDNSNIPIAGATVRALVDTTLYSSPTSAQTAASVQTDATGHFSIYKAPAGYVKLFVDGSTSSTLGPFPILEYDMVTVAGQVNTVNRSIYLIALKTSNQLCVTDTTGGGTLTIPDAPGFSLTFGPGQVTFPGGSKTGCVSVTQVHPDKVPMEPAFGQQPRFIVTIQPAGAVFSPPAPITIPNVDGLQPRQVTEMYSYDHDISSFVAIGTGMVSDDGQVIRSNPGVGVLKAGWHCGGNPQAGGTVADCPPCTYCQGSSANSVSCIPDPSQVGKACSSPLNNCYSGGTCGFTVVGGNGGQPTQIPIGVCVGGVPLTGTSCNAGGSVPAVCINGQCTGSGSQCNCNSPDPCTIAQCVNGTCSLTPNPQCQSCSGQASGTSPCGPCVDGGTCTNGSCVGGNPKLITNPTIQADGKTADTTGLNQSVVFSVQGLFQNCSTISIIVDFGDGSTPQAAAPSTFATSGVFSAQIQHSYGSTGTFTATATVQCDMCSFSYTTQVTVHVMQLGIVVLFDGGSFDGATVGLGSLASAIQQTFGNAVIQTEIGPGASLASQEGPASFFVASQLAAHPGARVILIGFSLGGDTAVLASINSYLRIALDPISRNLALGSFPVYDQSGTSFFSGPSNLTIDYHQHNTAASIGSCGIPLEGYTVTGSTNVDISYLGYGHCGLPGHTDIQNLIVSQISAALSAP